MRDVHYTRSHCKNEYEEPSVSPPKCTNPVEMFFNENYLGEPQNVLLKEQ